MHQTINDSLLDTKQVCQKLNIGRVTLWKLCKSDKFVKPVSMSLSHKRWRESDVDSWINQLPTGDK